jgi:hypothetical protein
MCLSECTVQGLLVLVVVSFVLCISSMDFIAERDCETDPDVIVSHEFLFSSFIYMKYGVCMSYIFVRPTRENHSRRI